MGNAGLSATLFDGSGFLTASVRSKTGVRICYRFPKTAVALPGAPKLPAAPKSPGAPKFGTMSKAPAVAKAYAHKRHHSRHHPKSTKAKNSCVAILPGFPAAPKPIPSANLGAVGNLFGAGGRVSPILSTHKGLRLCFLGPNGLSLPGAPKMPGLPKLP